MSNTIKISLAGLLLVCLLPAALSQAQQSQRPADFGMQWVQSRPFTIMGLTQIEATFDLDEYKGVGMTALGAWKPRKGLLDPAQNAGYPIHTHRYAKKGVTPEFKEMITSLLDAYPGIVGVMINDEPKLPMMKVTGEALEWMRQQYPDKLAYCNAYPIGGDAKEYSGDPSRKDYSYSDYFTDFAAIVQPDILMVDIYPFSEGKGSVSDVYWINLAVVRKTGLQDKKPYWTFVQSYQTTNRRHSSESDLRMQVYSSLTYGFTGIAYFTYDVAFDRGLLEPDGTPNALYGHAALLNQEVLTLGDTLRMLTSTDVRFIAGAAKAPPTGTPLWSKGAGHDPYILAIEAEKTEADRQVGLIGYFKDKANRSYFMLTNLWHEADLSADQAAQTFRIQFHPYVKQIYRINRVSGETERLAIGEDGWLEINLPGGTGDLFSYRANSD